MYRALLSILGFVICCNVSVIGQTITEFSPEKGAFLSELKTYMTASRNKTQEEIFDAFEEILESGSFTDEEYKTVNSFSTKMVGLKLNAATYFSNYLRALTSLKANQKNAEVFNEWHAVVEGLLNDVQNRKFKAFKDYLVFSPSFLGRNIIKDGKVSGVSWLAETDKYKLIYEDKIPSIEFEDIRLIGFRKKDSIAIDNTSGVYYPLEKSWIGTGGNVHWDRPSSVKSKVLVELTNYEIDGSKPFYTADSSYLTYPELFPNEKVLGKFDDKITASTSSKESSYPRFLSNKSVLKIDDIGDGISYKGGFRLEGSTVYGYGTPKELAEIIILNPEDKRIFRGASELFVIRKGERLSSQQTNCSIYFDQDSIFHPSVNIKFDIPKNIMTLTRGERGNDRNPFYNSYHKVNIDVDAMTWKVGKDTIVMGGRSVSFTNTNREVTFESFNYFQEGDYDRLQNIASTNPLIIIRAMADQEGTNFINANALAQKFNSRFDATSIQSLLYDLVSKGFVNYDSTEEIVEVKDKVFHYTNASLKKVDYDILKIQSVTDSTNAVLDIKSKNILSHGVKAIEFSQKQKVALKPHYGDVIMKENRNMDFNGKLFAGFTIYEGKDFHFDYEKNQIEMDSIRYFDLYVPTGEVDDKGEPIAEAINSRLENANGVLLIDAPNNKSGEEDIPIFPSFQSKEASFVYYDDTSVLHGVYNRDSFYFEVDPFSFNGLDDFEKRDLNFKGSMISADIFPRFKETLVLIEEDNSLGFTTETPTGGYPSYSSKGNYEGSISLGRNGFRGRGKLDYLSASVKSEDFIFRPRRLTGSAERFDLAEKRGGDIEIPQAIGLDVNIDWRPYVDSMYITSKEKEFALFKEGAHDLAGLLILTPEGLKGRGKFSWELGELNSKLLSFGAFSTISDTAALKILTFGKEDIAFDTKNVFADLNFETQLGKVRANEEGQWTTMPYNQYQTSLDEFIWDMKGATVTFQNEAKLLGNFRSIHPDQDSLIFQGNTAFYDLKTNQLKIGGVPYIKSCDAFIYLADGNVEVKPGGEIAELVDCKIVADTLNKYHVINKATVKVKGKKQYLASGFYEYNVGDRVQEIEFKDVVGTRVGKGKRSEKKTVTRATGTVVEADKFFIDQSIEYRGKISLSAEKKALEFDGFAKINSPILPKASWFSIKSESDKNNLAIQYDEPKNYDGQYLGAGIFLSKETAKLYPSFLMPLYYRKDRPLLLAKGAEKGLFKHDKKDDEFRFGDSTSVLNPEIPGNLLRLNNKTGKFIGSGKLNLCSALVNPRINAAGIVKGTVNENTGAASVEAIDHKIDVQAMAGLEFIIPDKLLKVIITDLQSSSFDARPIDYHKDTDFYESNLHFFIDDKKALDSEIAEMKSLGLDISGKYNPYTFLFSKLDLKWNVEYQSFINSKDIVGLASVGGVPINRLIKSYVEFKMPTNQDDRFYIYLISPSEDWYFFSYNQGILSTVSSNTRYNDILLGMKSKDLITKMKEGETYEVAPLNPNSAQLFLNRIKAAGN